jgi:hypothetical protein
VCDCVIMAAVPVVATLVVAHNEPEVEAHEYACTLVQRLVRPPGPTQVTR